MNAPRSLDPKAHALRLARVSAVICWIWAFTLLIAAMLVGSRVILAVLALMHVGLGLVQWKAPSRVLPLVFVALFSVHLLIAGFALVFTTLATGGTPGLWIALDIGLSGLSLVGHAVGFRGASSLMRLRRVA